jgi:hypothetical protein
LHIDLIGLAERRLETPARVSVLKETGPFLIALISFEALRRPAPVLSAYLAWPIPLAGAMALSLFAPRRYEALSWTPRARLTRA